MKRINKIVIAIAITVSLLTSMSVYGANATVSISKNTVRVGETNTITVTFSGTNIGRVNAQLNYDTRTLEYIDGGTSTGNSGAVVMSKASSGGDIVFQLKFKGVAEGSNTLNIITNESYDLEEQFMGTPTTTQTITITEATSGGGAENESTPEEEAPANKEQESETADNDSIGKAESSTNNSVYIFLAVAILIVLGIIIILVLKRKKGKK